MGLWTFWLVLAVGLLVAELFSQSLTCLYVGVGAACAMTACLLGGGWLASTVTFVASTAILYFSTIKLRRRLLARLHHTAEKTATGMDALVGRTAEVKVTDRPRVRIDGDVWAVRSAAPGVGVAEGDKVRVVGYDSIVLIVERIGEASKID